MASTISAFFAYGFVGYEREFDLNVQTSLIFALGPRVRRVDARRSDRPRGGGPDQAVELERVGPLPSGPQAGTRRGGQRHRQQRERHARTPLVALRPAEFLQVIPRVVPCRSRDEEEEEMSKYTFVEEPSTD